MRQPEHTQNFLRIKKLLNTNLFFLSRFLRYMFLFFRFFVFSLSLSPPDRTLARALCRTLKSARAFVEGELQPIDFALFSLFLFTQKSMFSHKNQRTSTKIYVKNENQQISAKIFENQRKFSRFSGFFLKT